MTEEEIKAITQECQCEFCQFSTKVESIIARKDPDELVQLVNDLVDQILNAESDNAYYEAILDGSWPGAKEILERALERAKTSASE